MVKFRSIINYNKFIKLNIEGIIKYRKNKSFSKYTSKLCFVDNFLLLSAAKYLKKKTFRSHVDTARPYLFCRLIFTASVTFHRTTSNEEG